MNSSVYSVKCYYHRDGESKKTSESFDKTYDKGVSIGVPF